MKLVIEGAPISKLRHRSKVLPAYGSKKYTVMSYDVQSKIKEDYRKKLAIGKQNCQNSIELNMEASYSVRLSYHLPVPVSSSNSKRNAKLWGFETANKKPDLDNYDKFILDCANGILWYDDSQIINLQSFKQYSHKPRTEIEIMESKVIDLEPYTRKTFENISPQDLLDMLNDMQELSRFTFFEDSIPESKYWFDGVQRELTKFSAKHLKNLMKISNATKKTTTTN